jgi:phytoene desaturase
LDSSKELYEFSIEEMLYKDYRSVLDLLNGKLLIKSYKLHLWENLEDYINKQFESDEARKILKYAIGFLGGAPQNTPSFYHLVSHADLAMGVWYPQGGMRKVVETLYELAKSYGTHFNFNEPVEKLEINDKLVTKVVSTKSSYQPDLVIVTADYPHSELELLSPEDQTYNRKYWEEKTISPSAMVVYLGVDIKVDKLIHHNLFLNKDWETGFDYIFDSEKADWPENPSYYVNVPSKTDESAAPHGSDTLYLLIPLASGMVDTPELRETLYNHILDDLESKIKVKLREHVQVKKLFAINDFKERYNAYKGTAFGLTHTLRQTALLRPSHRSKKADNLYYSGQYTHPGIGVPMVMVSSQIIVQDIMKRYGKR